MNIFKILTTLLFSGLMVAGTLSSGDRPATGGDPPPDAVTFAGDVAPILYENCVSCHRPGEIGPMSLLTYEEVRPWAPLIREKVVSREMPPWHADRAFHGRFSNERSLSDEEIATIAAWVDAGTPAGDLSELPPVPTFAEGWMIGEPDVVLCMPEPYAVPAEGVIPWLNFPVQTKFAEDRYVVAAEVRAGDRSVVHHGQTSVLGLRFSDPDERAGDSSLSQENRLQGYIPGHNPMKLRPGVAKIIPAGSRINFNMHYEPNGTPTTDRTCIGLIFADEPIERLLRTRMATVPPSRVDIPPRSVVEAEAGFTFPYDAYIDGLRPHMHERGVAMTYTLIDPDGNEEVLLHTNFDYRWQTNYVLKEPVFAPEGSRIHVLGTWDNTAANPLNPDPSVHVRYGMQAQDEMMVGYVEYTVADEDLGAEPTVRSTEAAPRFPNPQGGSSFDR